MKTEKHSPQWLLDKIKESDSNIRSLRYILKFQEKTIKEFRKGEDKGKKEDSSLEEIIKILYIESSKNDITADVFARAVMNNVGLYKRSRTCPNCNGKVHIIHCTICDGSGKI